MKRWGIVLFLLVFLGLSRGAVAEASSYGYDIIKYHVDIDVAEDNVYRIKESITVDFHQSRHGIYRYIPLTGKQYRTDGSGDTEYHGKVKNIGCGSEKYEVNRENGFCIIRLGDEHRTIQGEKSYEISYDYVYGKDPLENMDDFYWNVIGYGWDDTTISNVSFAIHMPKAFDINNLYIYYNSHGSEASSGLNYQVVGNSIIGEVDSNIVFYGPVSQGLTVRVILPEGYFTMPVEHPLVAYCTIILGFIAMATAFFLWWIYGRDDPVVETVEFHPPAGLNSLEAAYAYRGEATRSDAVSLVVYLAQKGYLEIQERDRQNFTLKIKKPYDGNNDAERIFMAGLSLKGNIITKNELKNSFYETLNGVVAIVKSQQRKKIFYANSLNKGWILYLMSALMFLLAGGVPIYQYTYSFTDALIGGLGVGIPFMLAFTLIGSLGRWLEKLIFILGFGIFALVIYVGYVAAPLADASIWYQIAYAFTVIASFVVLFFNAYLPKRTPYGNELLGKIRGFRNFLETAEKEKLELLVEQNPQYFYDILPYTYVLDVSKKWVEKFEAIATEPPDWYGGPHASTFHPAAFHHFMNHTMSSAKAAMTSQPSSKGGGRGGFSGGGFSGGGAGGGGGGSW